MVEVLNYAPAKEGLSVLGKFITRGCSYEELPPFFLPVRFRMVDNSFSQLSYNLGKLADVGERAFSIFLRNYRIAALGDYIYVIPHREITKGINPYYWLNIYAEPSSNSPALSSCRLRPEGFTFGDKIQFQGWHGLEEQLLADYTLGINGLRFENLLPFNMVDVSTNQLRNYNIAGVKSLKIAAGLNRIVQDGDTLRFIPTTDGQRLYEWFDILKVDSSLPEDRWHMVISYRILTSEHRIHAQGWLGPERQLIFDRIHGRHNIKFENLRPIILPANSGGLVVSIFHTYNSVSARKVNGVFSLKQGVLAQREQTISIPMQDDQGIYEWLELYSYDPDTNGAKGDMVASARITSEGLNQRDWLGVERQLLKDYTDGIVNFNQLRPISIKNIRGKDVYLWSDGSGKPILLRFPRRFSLKIGDDFVLIPEKELEEGADFILTKDGTPLARYRLNREHKKFRMIDNLIASAPQISPEEANEQLLGLLAD